MTWSDAFAPAAALLAATSRRYDARARWRSVTHGGIALATWLALAVFATRLHPWSAGALVAVMAVTLLVTGAIVVAVAVRLRARVPARQLARYIEERAPTLEDRLVTAIDSSRRAADAAGPSPLVAALAADASRVASTVDAAAIVSVASMRRARASALASVLAVVVAGSQVWSPVRAAWAVAALWAFPAHVTLQVQPGNVTVLVGTTVDVVATLSGTSAPATAELLLRAPDGTWAATPMPRQADGRFVVTQRAPRTSTEYKVRAAGLESATYTLQTLERPRIARIALTYRYPTALGLAPRTDDDSGDIYAPAGTDVDLRVYTDRPVTTAQWRPSDAAPVALAATPDGAWQTTLRIARDGAYRLGLVDAQGIASGDGAEYFIRVVDDRPPDVRITRPARDRRVTPLEEVEIAADASDDYGVASLELVYAVAGGEPHVVPLPVPASTTQASGRHLLYLEDLHVQPGDIVSYFARARDVARGRRSAEARSDIFFLEVRPFTEEFARAQSNAPQATGAGGGSQIDELVAAQKEVIAATWKLDRRAQGTGASSAQDIATVAKAEAELKSQVEQVASAFRQSALRDPRRSRSGPTGPPPSPPDRAGGAPAPPAPPAPTPPSPTPAPGGGASASRPRVTPGATASSPIPLTAEDDTMATASAAMATAIEALQARRTSDAVPHEMAALNALVAAQATVTQRQIQRQQGASGRASNRQTEDLSSLFDRELARRQETNYETRTSTETRGDEGPSLADQVRALAARQDELVRRQQDLARRRDSVSEEAARRELERLTRDQNALREQADALARQAAQSSGSRQDAGVDDSGASTPGGTPRSGSQGRAGTSGQRKPDGRQQGTPGRSGARTEAQALAAATEEMRGATGDLRREDPAQAAARAARARDQLQALDQQLQGGADAAGQRALGDAQLEARQLADAQRRLAAETARASGAGRADTLRRLAAEQERVAGRAAQLQQRLQQGGGAGTSGGARDGNLSPQQRAGQAARQLAQSGAVSDMQKAADALRSAARGGPGGAPDAAEGANGSPTQATSGAQERIARMLDRLADQMGAGDAPRDPPSRRLSDQQQRARELRDRMDALSKELAALNDDAPAGDGGVPSGTQGTGRSTSSAGPANGQSGGTRQSARSTEQLRQALEQQVRDVRDLIATAGQDDGAGRAAGGTTFQGQGMTLSDPGTQGFKQDFARWQELVQQVTVALGAVESATGARLQEAIARERLAVGDDGRVPAAYQAQVDRYFKALATGADR